MSRFRYGAPSFLGPPQDLQISGAAPEFLGPPPNFWAPPLFGIAGSSAGDNLNSKTKSLPFQKKTTIYQKKTNANGTPCWPKKKKWNAFAICGALLPLARLELVIFFPFYVVALFNAKKYLSILILGIPSILWALAGGLLNNNLFWIIDETLGEEKKENIPPSTPNVILLRSLSLPEKETWAHLTLKFQQYLLMASEFAQANLRPKH